MKLTSTVTGVQEVQAELRRIGSLPSKALRIAAEQAEDFAEAAAAKHNKTGKMVSALYKRALPDGWEVGHDTQVAPHVLFVHWGTRPHVIKPKNKKRLRWAAGGKFAFASKVNHPGYKGDAWMTRAAAAAPADFNRALQSLMSKEA